MLRNCYYYFYHSLHGDFWVCSWYHRGDDICNNTYFSFYFSVFASGINVSSMRRYLCHVWWTTASSRHSRQYCRLDDTCMPAALLLVCFWCFQGPRYRPRDDTIVPVRRWDGYLDRTKLIIVEATIPLLLEYLPQPLTVVSSPRRYLGRGRTSARPYSPLRSHEGAHFCIANESGMRSQSVPFSSSHCCQTNPLCLLPIVCSLSVPLNI